MAKMKLPKMKMAGLLNNRMVLYLTLLVSLVYIVKDIYAKNNFNVALFLLIGYIVSMYSRNMIVILAVPLLLLNGYEMSKKSNLEGMMSTIGDLRKVKKKNPPPKIEGMNKINAGGGAFNAETKNLMKQQKELMKNVRDLEPLMNQANKFLKNIDKN
jgi:hypothetical protein